MIAKLLTIYDSKKKKKRQREEDKDEANESQDQATVSGRAPSPGAKSLPRRSVTIFPEKKKEKGGGRRRKRDEDHAAPDPDRGRFLTLLRALRCLV